MQTIYLDISNRGVIPVIYAKQGDVGRKVEVVLTNSGLPYEPEAGSAFSAWYSGASGVGNYTDIGGKPAFSVSGNKVMVELITQMLENAGEGILCLVLSRAGGDQIGLWNIRYICEGIPGAGSEAAKDYYTAFSQAVAGLAYPDASLSIAGKAADAAAVGTALAGKAPAGYGLGENGARWVDNPDTALKPGWYATQTPTIGWIRVDAYDTSKVVQTFYREAYNGLMMVRYVIDGVFSKWEYIFPPMAPGEEYRTAERWNGKVVYARFLNLGIAANGASYTVSEATRIVRHVGFVGNNPMPFWTEQRKNPYYFAESKAEGTKLILECDNGADGLGVGNGKNKWDEQIWYTKD